MTDATTRELILDAKCENLDQVISFVESCLEETACPMKALTQINISVEEIFVNIAHYAYSELGEAKITTVTSPDSISITFADSGVPYDPLAKPDPDVTLSAAERAIGGLGIFMIKNLMDSVTYKHEDGKNILTITKNFK